MFSFEKMFETLENARKNGRKVVAPVCDIWRGNFMISCKGNQKPHEEKEKK